MNYNLEDIMCDLKSFVLSAGKMLINKNEEDIIVKEKLSFKDLVTNMDEKIQSYLITNLKEKYNDALFISEEQTNEAKFPVSEWVFVIDPIDGTSNFVKGMNYSCISVGCILSGEIVAGVVYNPYSDELFSAIKGCGAYLNETPISISDSEIHESLVLFGTSPYDNDTTDDTFEKVKKIYTKCLDIRRIGSAALDICNVACGRAGLYFEGRLSLWDYAAASVILSEASGVMCNYCGEKISYSLDKTSVIAGSRLLIEQSGLLKEQ